MSTRDVRLKTIQEISDAVNARKEITVWNTVRYEPGVAVRAADHDTTKAWDILSGYDFSEYWFSIKEEVPEYRAFKTVEEVEPFLGHTICKTYDKKYGNGSHVILVITGVEERPNGSINIWANGAAYVPEAMLSFKFTKTGKPVGIEVK